MIALRTLLLASMALSLARPALADCGEPPVELVWSHPQHLATDVPTDVELAVLSRAWVAEVRLDGEVLQPPYDHGGLQPDTAYTLEVALSGVDGGEQTYTVDFHTGVGPWEGPVPSVAIEGASRTEAWDHLSAACKEAALAVDCFDNGQDTHVVLHLQGEAAFHEVEVLRSGARLHHFIWPGDCGDISYFTFGRSQDHGDIEELCYEVTSVGPSGERVTSAPFCASAADLPELGEPATPDPEPGDPLEEDDPGAQAGDPDGEDASLQGGCGCTTGLATTGPWWLLAGALAWRRRR